MKVLVKTCKKLLTLNISREKNISAVKKREFPVELEYAYILICRISSTECMIIHRRKDYDATLK